MAEINYLLGFVFNTLIMILLVRIWLQQVRADFYNPLSQFVVKISNPLVIPLRRIIPGFGGIDVATLLLAYLVATIKFFVLTAIYNEGISIPIVLYIGLITLVEQFGVLLFIIMLVMALMSWVVQGYNPTQVILHQLTEPFLKPIRRIVPSIGGLDLSVLIAFLSLNVINMLIGRVLPYWGMF